MANEQDQRHALELTLREAYAPAIEGPGQVRPTGPGTAVLPETAAGALLAPSFNVNEFATAVQRTLDARTHHGP